MKLRLCLAALLLVAACDSNTVEPDTGGNGGGGGGGGGDDGVSFSSAVLPIFQSSCSGSGCHAPGGTSGVNLSTWGDVTGSEGAQYGTRVVVAGSAAASPLVEKLGASPRFGSRMPLGASPLSSAQVTTIRTWIDEGAKNN